MFSFAFLLLGCRFGGNEGPENAKIRLQNPAFLTVRLPTYLVPFTQSALAVCSRVATPGRLSLALGWFSALLNSETQFRSGPPGIQLRAGSASARLKGAWLEQSGRSTTFLTPCRRAVAKPGPETEGWRAKSWAKQSTTAAQIELVNASQRLDKPA